MYVGINVVSYCPGNALTATATTSTGQYRGLEQCPPDNNNNEYLSYVFILVSIT